MLLNLEDHRRQARRQLPNFVFEYIDGGAETEACLRSNRTDFDGVNLIPRVLRDTRDLDASIEVFGSKWRYPFGIAPTGLNGLVRPGGDGMLAAAAQQQGVPFILSTASNQRAEEVRQMGGSGEQWLQLYVMQDRALAEQLVRRAKTVGFKALVLTVDVPVGGNRWRDARNGFGIPLKITPRLVADVLRRPAWAMRFLLGGVPQFVNLRETTDAPLSPAQQASLLARTMDRSLVWESLRWLRALWDGPLLLKGVMHGDDARLAQQHGVDGLVVSNHGGRQFDAAPSAIQVLPQVVDSVKDRLPVFMDGGVCSGLDVLRAQAMGARAAFVGRATLYGLAHGAQSGVTSVLRMLADDYQRNMVLLGAKNSTGLRAHLRVAWLCQWDGRPHPDRHALCESGDVNFFT